jgi:hypothetical protein
MPLLLAPPVLVAQTPTNDSTNDCSVYSQNVEALKAALASSQQQLDSLGHLWSAQDVSNWQAMMARQAADVAKAQQQVAQCMTSRIVIVHPSEYTAAPPPSCDPASIAATNQAIADLHNKIMVDESALKRAQSIASTSGVDDWLNLSQDARAKLVKQTIDSLLDLASDAAEKAIKRGEKIDQINVDDVIEKYGLDGTSAADALYNLAAKNRNDPLWGARMRLDIKVLDTGRTLAFLDNLGSLIKYLLFQTPVLKPYALLASDVEFTTASIYNNITRQVGLYELKRLAAQSEEQLNNIQNYNQVLRKHVAELNARKWQIASCSAN